MNTDSSKKGLLKTYLRDILNQTMEVVYRERSNCEKQTWFSNWFFKLKVANKRAWSNKFSNIASGFIQLNILRR